MNLNEHNMALEIKFEEMVEVWDIEQTREQVKCVALKGEGKEPT